MSAGLEFSKSAALSMGVELELQILNTRDCDLTRGASDLLALLGRRGHPWDIKPEITESMIEVATGVHTAWDPMLSEMQAIRGALCDGAERLNLAIAGGGAHPFQHWSERQIYENPRFHYLSDLYGYLAKQFTVFGQHIHIGCASGDDAMYLLHALSRYIPHFIALAGSSPYYQGVDSAFDSSRLNSIFAFPLSGRAPFCRTWEEFNAYFARMQGYGIVKSMKDFYWDIRPKPEYGTVEIRVCDTPLTVERAAALGAYAQALSSHLLQDRPFETSEDLYLVYNYNRFQACRFGLGGQFIDAFSQTSRSLSEDILATLELIAPHARVLDCGEPLRSLRVCAEGRGNDATWMRMAFARNRSMEDLMWQTSRLWMGEK